MAHQDDQDPGTGLPPAEYYSTAVPAASYLADDQGYQGTVLPLSHAWGDGYHPGAEYLDPHGAPDFGSYDDYSYNAPLDNGPATFIPSYASSAAGSSTTALQWGSVSMSPLTLQSPESVAFTYDHLNAPLEPAGQATETPRSKRKPAQKDTSPPSKNTKKKGKAVAVESKPKKKKEAEPKAHSKSKGKKALPSSSSSSTHAAAATKAASIPTPSSLNPSDDTIVASSSPANQVSSSHHRKKPTRHHSPPPSEVSYDHGDWEDDGEYDYDDYDDDDDDDGGGGGGGGGTGPPTQRERNRKAATKCRAKTKAAITQLEGEEREASDRRHTLSTEAAALRSEVLFLRDMVLEHHSCGCVDKQNYIRNAAELLGRSGGRNPIWGKDGSGDDWAGGFHLPGCEFVQASSATDQHASHGRSH